jgi:co-chaperonin GroES (HSP10)
MPLVPKADRILIRPVVKEKTDAGLILAKNPTARLEEGVVVAVGEGTYTLEGKLLPNCVVPGERVYFLKPHDGPYEVTSDGEKLIIISATHVVAGIV